MKIMNFAASLRKDSFNRKMINQVVEILKSLPLIEIDHADFREFEMPIYDGDLEESSGIPHGGLKLIKRIQEANALIISTPEYNGGIPGSLKNAIDWVSRVDPIPFKDKPVLLLGATPGGLGTIRSLWHTRVPLEAIGAFVYPEMFGIPAANKAFDQEGKFINPEYKERLKNLISSYLRYASALIK
ncbi:MAG: NAD(P)H-dependent oxidoreductase [Oligoflexia bacterium]|nr:NAD(P)H-dependent oxidoreductase [Oligoflexia bacterium]